MSDGPTQMARDRQRKLMDAWHLATPRAREIALAALSGRLDCQYCAVPYADCPYPDNAHGIDFCGDWKPTPRDGER
jgi:hypothetical protein